MYLLRYYWFIKSSLLDIEGKKYDLNKGKQFAADIHILDAGRNLLAIISGQFRLSAIIEWPQSFYGQVPILVRT